MCNTTINLLQQRYKNLKPVHKSMKSLVSKLNMAASDEVDVVLNQNNTDTQRKRQSQTGQGQMLKKKEMVKLGNTQVNRGSKNVSLRHLFNGLS